MLVKALEQTLSDFARDRSHKRLSYNQEQIHKFDKLVIISRVSGCLSIMSEFKDDAACRDIRQIMLTNCRRLMLLLCL